MIVIFGSIDIMLGRLSRSFFNKNIEDEWDINMNNYRWDISTLCRGAGLNELIEWKVNDEEIS